MAIENAVKIFAVCLTSAKKCKAYAAFNGEQLVLLAVTPISGLFSTWKEPLIAEIEQKKSEGFIVLVDEAGDRISQYATRYCLDEVDEDSGRTKMQAALDAYFEMAGMDALHLSQECQRFELRMDAEGGWLEKKNDDKGRSFFSIDWRRIHGAHRALLLCVVAANYEPVSSRYLSVMFGESANNDIEENSVLRWKKTFTERALGKEEFLMGQRGQT